MNTPYSARPHGLPSSGKMVPFSVPMTGHRFRAKLTQGPLSHPVREVTRCLYGISMGTNKPLALVAESFQWVQARYADSAILLGDGLYRITLQIQEGLNAESATVTARREGDRVLRVFAELVELKRDNILRSSDLMRRPEFVHALGTVNAVYANNGPFRKAVKSDALHFIGRQERTGRLAMMRDQAINLSVRYLIEEIAVYLLLAEEGWLLDAHFGEELPTLAKIIEGRIPAAPKLLQARTNLAIRLR